MEDEKIMFTRAEKELLIELLLAEKGETDDGETYGLIKSILVKLDV